MHAAIGIGMGGERRSAAGQGFDRPLVGVAPGGDGRIFGRDAGRAGRERIGRFTAAEIRVKHVAPAAMGHSGLPPRDLTKSRVGAPSPG